MPPNSRRRDDGDPCDKAVLTLGGMRYAAYWRELYIPRITPITAHTILILNIIAEKPLDLPCSY
jgi:hypothetical protein